MSHLLLSAMADSNEYFISLFVIFFVAIFALFLLLVRKAVLWYYRIDEQIEIAKAIQYNQVVITERLDKIITLLDKK